jgi:hypothetical protein
MMSFAAGMQICGNNFGAGELILPGNPLWWAWQSIF